MANIRARALRVACVAAVVAAATGVTVLATDQRATPRSGQTRTATTTYNRVEAEVVARRLYRALLGREADESGLTAAVGEIQRGNLQNQVEGMTRSSEFERRQLDRNAAQLLDDFYGGLMGRKPDAAGISAFLPRMQSGRHASVLMEMLSSPEFRQVLAKEAGTGGGTTTGGGDTAATAPARVDAALDCQARLLDRLRSDTPGRPFLSFDRLPEVSSDGRSVQGQAVDRFDADRQLSYSCNGQQVSYSYRDGRPPRGGDRGRQFESAAVRNCQNEVGRDAVFDAASLTITDTSTEWVLGLIGGRRYTCETAQQRVLSMKSR